MKISMKGQLSKDMGENNNLGYYSLFEMVMDMMLIKNDSNVGCCKNLFVSGDLLYEKISCVAHIFLEK